ncbi:MAG TPA: Mov34/MPN/PAD-1 family protein [Methanobacteriaceae archaeon]|nr:Mov34/MPN/PAD-1 family protein [Methanobacteriaceae archaeon]
MEEQKKPGLLDRLIGHILGNDTQKFLEVHIDGEVINEIVQIARESHPNEFVALLEGKIKENILKIDGLVFLPGETSNQGAVMKTFMKPLVTGTVGSVHSHPGYNASPSNADLYFFSKNGLFHLIIAEPYEEYSIRAYDTMGMEAEYRIV